MNKKISFLILCVLLSGCAGPNPNPGERTIDMAINRGSLSQSCLDDLRMKAKDGLPWAQLRMGVINELGNGVKKNLDEAENWYTLASKHYGDNNWSKGQLIGAFGKPGYFNQNSDALVAKYQLAGIYLNKTSGKFNLDKGYDLIKEVKEKSENKHIFYCCEFAGGRYITVGMINSLLQEAEEMKDKENNKK